MTDTMHPCTLYAMEVTDGQRVVGKSEYLACKRHLDDLQRVGNDDFPYIFDEGRANKIYHWFQFCHHVEGRLAGQPIELEPFQLFDQGCMFGWIHKDTEARRFQKAYIQEARKNGKTTRLAGIANYMLCGDGEESPNVYCAAVDREQARILYRNSMRMAQKSPDIRRRLKIRNYMMSHATRGGEMKALSKDTMNKDGLNPSCAIIDEYHAHETSEIYDVIWSAWGQRYQALMVIITTAGMNVDNSPCYKEYQYCKQILSGLVTNDQYFVMIRELDEGDDEHDPANWIKANPLRASTPEGLEILKAQHDEAFRSRDPSKVRTFRVKILNIWVHGTENTYMDEILLAQWDECAIPRELFNEMTKGRKCIAGVDLSKKIDLTADAFLFLLDDGRIGLTAHGFMPEETVERHEKTDRIPYRDWAKDGWLTMTPGNVTDYGFIKTHIADVELELGWSVMEFTFDPWNATHFASEMANEGYTTVEIRQGFRTLSEPTKLLREMIGSGKVVHDGNPILKWNLANAVAETDSNDNIKLSKKNASDTHRIDLAAALINAMVRLMALKAVQGNGDISAQILAEDWGM